MTDTLYQRTERAWFLAVDLDVSVGHLVEALDALTAGNIIHAHWCFWRAGLTKFSPHWQPTLPMEAAQ